MQPPMYLAGEAFDLLAVRVPNEVLNGIAIADFDDAIGMTREQFAAFLKAISSEGQTAGWADRQTAATLRNALAVVVLELNSSEFEARVGYTHEEATELLTQLNTYLRKESEATN